MLVEALTQEDKYKIDAWRQAYAWSSEEEIQGKDYADVETILSYWDSAKSKYLYTLLGNQFTVSFPISYQKSEDELRDEIVSLTFPFTTFGMKKRCGYTFYNNFTTWAAKQFNPDTAYRLFSLVSEDTLLTNIYEGEPIEIELPDRKKYQIKHGVKAMRVLGKLANIFNIEGFEDFRICHSLILNDKCINGTITLSIHPLDYMTMSDNDCDWDSCMSWAKEGDYRLGTVEMMNSPTVIMAYISAEEPMEMPLDAGFWNNKRWRQLFVVDKNVILSVKGYPFCNDEISCLVVSILKDLALKNLGWKYGNIQKYNNEDEEVYFNGKVIDFFLESEAMYSDLFCVSYHFLALKEDLTEEDFTKFKRFNSHYEYIIPYSGVANCMICGREIDVRNGEAHLLTCCECQHLTYCYACDEPVASSDIFWIDGNSYCPSCYDNYVRSCEHCYAEHDKDNMFALTVIPRLSLEEQEILKKRIEAKSTFSYVEELARKDLDSYGTNYDLVDDDLYTIHLCEDCKAEWLKENLKEGCYPHQRWLNNSIISAIYYDELLEPEAWEQEATYMARLKRYASPCYTKLVSDPIDF